MIAVEGIDPGTRKMGVTTDAGAERRVLELGTPYLIRLITTPSRLITAGGRPRLRWLVDQALGPERLRGDQRLVVLEGPAGLAKPTHDLPKLRAILEWEWGNRGATVIEVSPPKLKKFVTGNGNASGDEVREVICNAFGVDVGEDEAASAGLYCFGCHLIERAHPLLPLSANQLDAIKLVPCPPHLEGAGREQ